MIQDRNISATFVPRSVDRYLLTITSLPSSAGYTSGADEYDFEFNATISATPTTGYSFTGWSGDGIANKNLPDTHVIINQDRNITANFSINFYDLNISANEKGDLSGGGSFSYGTEANISASPSTGYSFTRWSGDGVVNPLAQTTQVRMTEDRNVSAIFSINSYELKISASDGGIVSDSGSFSFGSYATIKASPISGYSFLCWHGEGVDDRFDSTTRVFMNQNRNISASFTMSLSSGLRTSFSWH